MPNETKVKRAYRKLPKCPHCGAQFTTHELGVMLSGMKRTHAGGRPRDPDKPRCPCGQMTANRANKTGHRCDTNGLLPARQPGRPPQG